MMSERRRAYQARLLPLWHRGRWACQGGLLFALSFSAYHLLVWLPVLRERGQLLWDGGSCYTPADLAISIVLVGLAGAALLWWPLFLLRGLWQAGAFACVWLWLAYYLAQQASANDGATWAMSGIIYSFMVQNAHHILVTLVPALALVMHRGRRRG
ncbi:hypothetical protein [Aeromonas diversa]|uniref:hypothetical protein n=1 Tax=Aeromonas diversa TaxID=502790 RepID=UPI0034635ECA